MTRREQLTTSTAQLHNNQVSIQMHLPAVSAVLAVDSTTSKISPHSSADAGVVVAVNRICLRPSSVPLVAVDPLQGKICEEVI